MASRTYIYCAAHDAVVEKNSNGRLDGDSWVCEKCVKDGKTPKPKEGTNGV